MPLYNKRQYVLDSIKSVQSQTYSNWELIIVDDGSTDGSADVVPDDDSRIKLFRQSNSGPGAARNAAVKKTSGDYVAFIDADDWYYPIKLQKEVELLWHQHEAEWMMSAYDYQLNGVTKRYYMRDIHNAEIKDATITFNDTLNQLTVAGWPSDGLFMKKTLFEQLGGFREDLKFGEISEFILRIALKQPVMVICHIPLYLHIDVPWSTAKSMDNRVRYQRQMGETLALLAKEYPRYANLLRSKGCSFMISYGASLLMDGKRKEVRNFLHRDFNYKRNKYWWKLWAGSWLPRPLLKRLM
jgi:glycosyltransferase involved in cell wall biosynthesis